MRFEPPSPKRLSPVLWEIPAVGGMRVPARIYASAEMMEPLRSDDSLRQICEVAMLPGIVRAAFAMPDAHQGYGFPIGGVAAMDPEAGGVVSPGGVGYDINCGVRLLRTGLEVSGIRSRIRSIVDAFFATVPAGVGSHGAIAKVTGGDLDALLETGAEWGVKRGYGIREDLERIESRGRIPGADPSLLSKRAKERGGPQLGTLGSGNHFLELDLVREIFDGDAARDLGLFEGQLVLQIHTGSRGLGYQVCDDALREFKGAAKKYGLPLPDPQLVSVPWDSPEGERYRGAMAAAANFAFANRQILSGLVRDALARVLGLAPQRLEASTVWDVAHNIVKLETHVVDGRTKKLAVHRKGATRAFGPGHPDLPDIYRECGQPVLIPGDMGRASWVLVGTKRAMEETFGSTCHGAGRRLSRSAALRQAGHRDIVEELARKGIEVAAQGRRTVVEEMPEAYKDVSEVVDVVVRAGLARRVARLEPIGVVKG
jgi:tRNA-splicing ligase RtcB